MHFALKNLFVVLQNKKEITMFQIILLRYLEAQIGELNVS